MTRQLHNRYPGPGGMFAVSFAIHAILFLVIIYGNLLPAPHQEEEQVTYVDVATLPVASPQSGTPAPAAASAADESEAAAPPAPAPPPPPPAQPKAEMALPAPRPKAKSAALQPKPAKAARQVKQAPAEDAQEFNDRLAKLEQQADDRRMSDVMARLKGKGRSGRTGMPGARGNQAGSDYASYVKSRLRDALRERMNLQTKSPVAVAVITVGADGRIDYRMQKPSGDPLFDDAVAEAITLAGKALKPPPGGGQFRSTVTFKPDSVGVR